ncbi:hypothetical protein PNEG_01045 [Pneumocystis murina B123]|uniref:Beta-catenin-like protein 1 N-terminal domain-containing protein n=1 Tax=Pneumocystis murina (strain B123) TaxID=1069680 RepID=M7PKC0_PNEMU|nr:hypothetical protein PNEG_01045 [Pneumocystis murina B123]EMR10899.1 hypothetical protein PNEG_01045 [Pneumocystis murina B123]
MEIDDLFKKPEPVLKKRKIVPINPTETFKNIQNTYVEKNGRNNTGFGNTLDNSVSYGVGEEDERFFGGGLTKGQEDILDFIDENDKNEAIEQEKIDASSLKKMVLKLERAITKNQELRMKYSENPEKFLSSEADLDSEIKALSVLSGYPELYSEILRLGCYKSLIGLLSHENADIAISVLELLDELIDDDIDHNENQMKLLINSLIEAQLFNALTDNMTRFNEFNESDRRGVFLVLSILENISSFSHTFSENAVSSTNILEWLLQRLQIKEFPISQNKQYVAELLAIYTSSSSFIRKKIIDLNGVDIFLHILSPYRKRDPVKDIEEEFVENIFDCLCSLLEEQEGKEKFIDAEGVELCLIMLRHGKISKYRSLKVLDHALGGFHSISCCERLVEAAGLKIIFSIFMKKPPFKVIEYLLGIFLSLLRLLPIDSISRIRTLAKFVEKDYEKILRLMELRKFYKFRVDSANKKMMEQLKGLSQDERIEKESEIYFDLVDAGLYSLQVIDLILAWLCIEDVGIKKKVQELLEIEGQDLLSIKAVLQEYLNNMQVEDSESDKSDNVMKEIEMVKTLLTLLH